MSSFVLTPHQQNAYDIILNHYNSGKKVVLLHGIGGSGKTFLTKKFAEHFGEMYPVCGIAPTHKAKRVLRQRLCEESLIATTCSTIASVLGKIKEHSYIGTKHFSAPNIKKFNNFRFFILDEVSMCDDKDVRFIIEYMNRTGKLLLILGDRFQIPCPSSGYEAVNETAIRRADSFVFTDVDIPKVELTEIKRQLAGSSIAELCAFVRTHIEDDISIQGHTFLSGGCILTYPETDVIPDLHMYERFKSWTTQSVAQDKQSAVQDKQSVAQDKQSAVQDKQSESVSANVQNGQHFVVPPNAGLNKIIAYTNQAVRTHNLEVRAALNYMSKYVIGDILTGYTSVSVGIDEFSIENGQDYYIKNIKHTTNYSILKWCMLCGDLLDLVVLGTETVIRNSFFINMKRSENIPFIKELIQRAEIVNSRNSSKLDYAKYMELKSQVLFMDDIYKYDGVIYTESDFKEKHPLLFTRLEEVIQEGFMMEGNAMAKRLETEYDGLITKRLADNKLITESEVFADKYKVIEKDIYYGYAITAHKSQGSTYLNVMVDEVDFEKIQSRFNHRFGKFEMKNKEKNQLRYVAYSRPKEQLVIVHNEREKV